MLGFDHHGSKQKLPATMAARHGTRDLGNCSTDKQRWRSEKRHRRRYRPHYDASAHSQVPFSPETAVLLPRLRYSPFPMPSNTSTPAPILVCGGAGYIGSHMCKQLTQAGYLPVSFDNLSTGHRRAVQWGPLAEGDLLDPEALQSVFRRWDFAGVMHFAALSQVGESMAEPERYFRNNVMGTLNLLDAVRAAGVDSLVFSSTAAVYGTPESLPITEDQATQPINPYGWSKLMAERLIAEQCRAHGLRAVCLRYFNAAGADPDGDVGEAHEPETHLIPNLLRAGMAPGGEVSVFGTDYPTRDGTCVRDYVHVHDLCAAHLLALAHAKRAGGFHVFNLGSGQGHSVAEVLAQARTLCDGRPAARYEPRRPGDPPVLVASSQRANKVLGWQPYLGLADMLSTALAWHQAEADRQET